MILDISSILEVQVIAGDINDHKMLSILTPNFETFILAHKERFSKADLYELFLYFVLVQKKRKNNGQTGGKISNSIVYNSLQINPPNSEQRKKSAKRFV